MRFEKTPAAAGVEILASDDFQAIPVRLTGTETVPAGMPVTAAGAAAPDGTGAAGILLYDVNPADNPNGALVVSGIVDWAQCREHAGATATAETMKGILPGVTFRENTGVNAADAV